MKKNDVIATLGSVAFLIALFGLFWVVGNYPLVVVFSCIGIIAWGVFYAMKSQIKEYLDERDGLTQTQKLFQDYIDSKNGKKK